MSLCPVCQTEYPEQLPDLCATCGWNLKEKASEGREQAIVWAQQMWAKLQAQSQFENVRSQLQTAAREREQLLQELVKIRTEQAELRQQLKPVTEPETVAESPYAYPESLAVQTHPDFSPTPVDYSTLQAHLERGQWLEADLETALLMVAIAGSERQTYLTQSSLERFPCSELLEIDRLWLEASQGQFGFSVQREIYQSLGGKRFANAETWREFGDLVGWRINQTWLEHPQLNFSLEAPAGHLPVMGNGIVWFVSSWEGSNQAFSILISRLIQCSL